ncbi:S-adenosylmethionine transporter [Boothiomyces sp. JEL0866]|nr:S-adenosylmethionine transporter [Boothiomyces sp. JEL0866]
MHPLDTLKTQLQTHQPIVMKNLGRGFTISFLLAAPQGGLRLSTYEYSKSFLSTKNIDTTLGSAISACAGDTVSSIVKVPREVVTARLQSGVDLKSLKGGNPAVETMKMIVREQGVKGLFRGFWSTTARDWPFMVILFTTYDSFKHKHQAYIGQEPDDITTVKSTIFGGISGGLAGFLTTPFDVIKTNIMTKSSSSSIFVVGKELLKKNGTKAFFVGGGARSVWWFCVCSMFFPMYEAGKATLGSAFVKEYGHQKLVAG